MVKLSLDNCGTSGGINCLFLVGHVHLVCFMEVEQMVPEAWSDKRERQYEHIKESEKKKGRSMKRAKEIAARTVNKIRRKKGEVKGK